jgi:hypothetical protein
MAERLRSSSTSYQWRTGVDIVPQGSIGRYCREQFDSLEVIELVGFD